MHFLDFSAPVYQVLLFKLMPGDDSVGDPRALIAASERIVELSEGWEQVLTIDRSPEGWIFLIKGVTDEETQRRLAGCVSELKALAADYPELQYFGGVGPAAHRIGDIRGSYQEAGRAFAGRFFTEPNQVIRAEDVARLHQHGEGRIDLSSMRSHKAERERVDRFLKNGTLEEADNFLEEYFLDIGEQNFQSLLYRQYMVMDLYFSVIDFLEDLEIGAKSLPPGCRDVNEAAPKTA